MTSDPISARGPLVAVLGAIAALGLARAAARLVGLAVLLGIVVASIGVLTVGVLLLRAAVLH